MFSAWVRPPEALAIVDALSGLRTGQATNLEQARAAAFLYRPAMVGRARAREALVEATSKMHARGAERPLFATLCSPAGMGKSRPTPRSCPRSLGRSGGANRQSRQFEIISKSDKYVADSRAGRFGEDIIVWI